MVSQLLDFDSRKISPCKEYTFARNSNRVVATQPEHEAAQTWLDQHRQACWKFQMRLAEIYAATEDDFDLLYSLHKLAQEEGMSLWLVAKLYELTTGDLVEVRSEINQACALRKIIFHLKRTPINQESDRNRRSGYKTYRRQPRNNGFN